MLRNRLHVYGAEDILRVPADLNYGQHMLHRITKFGDNVAIVDAATGKSLTFAEAAQLTVDVALSLARIGVRKGDVVSISSEERLEYIPTLLGIICAGAVYTSTGTSGEAIIQHRVQLVKPKVVFCSPQVYDAHRGALSSAGGVETFVLYGAEPHDGATLFEHFLTEHAPVERFIAAPVRGADHCIIWYSSGTTGLPKAVPKTHLNLLNDVLTIIDFNYYPGQLVLTALDIYMYSLGFLHAGASILFILKERPLEILEAIQKYKVKVAQQMPSTMFEVVHSPLMDKYDVSSLERLVFTSAPLTDGLVKALKMRFPNLRDTVQQYGAMEIGVMTTDESAPKGTKSGSVGYPSAGCVMKVVDLTTREPLGVNQRGEICAKGPSIFNGYLGDTTFSYLDEEGFYRTGDVGYYDEDRYFYLVDRITDIIKYNAYSVSPALLENVLLQHTAVYEAAVVGAPDEQCYELPTAFVVLRPGAEATGDELVAYVNDQVAASMPLAGGVRIVAALPRGRRGKVDRKALRRMLSEQ